MSLSLVFLKPDLVIDSEGTVIEDTTIEVPLPSYDYIDPEVKKQTESISQFSGVLSYLALAILLILLFKGSYPLLLTFEVFQNLYFHYFIIEQLPYNFSNFILSLKYLNFQFLPSLFQLFIPSDYESDATPQKFKLAITDTTFFISAGHYFLVIAFYILWVIVIAIFKNKQICKFRKLRRFAQNVYENRIRFGIINECMWFCFMTFMVFGLWQFYDLNFPYDWSYANLAVAILCILLCLIVVVWVVYLSLKYRGDPQNIPKKFKFVAGDESFLPYQMPLRYIRKMLLCFFIFSRMVELQVVAMIASNFLILAFYIIYRPSKSKFSNWINIFIELCYIGLELTIMIFVNDFEVTTDKKLEYGKAMIGFTAAALLLITIWMIWQFLLFLYDFKFIRDIVEETKVANKVHPEEDNLKLQMERQYKKEELISRMSESQSEGHVNHQEQTVEGIQKQYDTVFHYDEKPKMEKKNDKFERINSREESENGNEPRLVSSRNSSRMLFADINIDDIE